MRSPGMVVVLLLLAAAATHCTRSLSANADGVNSNHSPALHSPALHSSASQTSLFLPTVHGPPPPKLIIAAAHIDSAVSYEPDEAILLANIGGSEQALAGWQITANNRSISFPPTSTCSAWKRTA